MGGHKRKRFENCIKKAEAQIWKLFKLFWAITQWRNTASRLGFLLPPLFTRHFCYMKICEKWGEKVVLSATQCCDLWSFFNRSVSPIEKIIRCSSLSWSNTKICLDLESDNISMKITKNSIILTKEGFEPPTTGAKDWSIRHSPIRALRVRTSDYWRKRLKHSPLAYSGLALVYLIIILF